MQLSLFDREPQKKATKASVYFQYFILISPDEKTRSDVFALKKKLNSFIGISKKNLTSIPHLSLWLQPERMCCDNLIMNETMKAVDGMKSFTVAVKGATVFNHIRTKSLVLNIENPEPVKQIFERLHTRFLFPPHELAIDDFTPHITIARTVLNSDFYKINDYVKEFDHTCEFLCDKITILRRTVTEIEGKKEFSKYIPVADVRLQEN